MTQPDKVNNSFERENFYKTLIEMSPNAILVHTKGKFIFSNQAGLNLLGGTFEDIEKIPVIDFVHPDDKKSVIKRIGDMEKNSVEAPPSIEKLIKLDGTVILAEVYGKPIRYGEIDANLLIVKDVTQQIGYQEKLLENEIRNKAIHKALPDLVLIINKSGQVQDFNVPENAHLYIPRPNLIGTNIVEILPEKVSKLYFSKIKITLKTKETSFIEYQLPFPSGMQTLEGRFIYYDKNKVLVLVRNITSKKAVEDEQLRTIKMESIGLLAGGIAHDFNNILMKILGNVNLAKVNKEISKGMLNFLTEIELATLQAKKLTNQLSTFSKGGEPITKVESIVEIIEESILFFLSGSKSKVIRKYADEKISVDVDASQMEQVISNLIINADQSMPEGGTIEITVDVINLTNENKHFQGVIEGNYVKISITDHGIGIPRENIDRIFEPYFTTKQTGSGLGLTTSYSIVKRHHGYMDVESSSGEGTTFFVYLPYKRKELPSSDTEPAMATPKHVIGKILVMDDSEDIQQILGKMLEHLGYTYDLACKGEEAITKYKEVLNTSDPFIAVILDLTIPGAMGGKKCLEELLKVDPNIKAIVSSGYSNDPIMANYHEFGFSGVLPKPYGIDDLKKVLNEIF